ncbi:phage portal protein [Moraxella catarrhalis]|uniref:phage portal protein n=1 Tax=Moraxella catarrhalis TaxID=480 RepID=UPI000202A444|nr:phage portal protein [Moraxella catarrhalis]AKI26993.1 portal protein [Moraxella phage Mcat1]AKI27045.1 portal protein [Moraxella phage Mcat2]AKI27083.1 portal protein [Moraxella phage Mcat3]EGE13416.1 putative portal protein [Moraxella catarrhalis 103P14B1]EGE18880.1 putative portal protein [Moraxella catarrhalis BC8]
MGFFDLFRKKSVNATPAPAWQTLIHEPYTGAWQKNDELKRTDLTHFHAVFACISLIAADIGKLRIQTKSSQNGVLLPTKSRTHAILKKPNRHQSWQQFIESWVSSKLLRGNAYVLKQRDIFGDVWQMYVLNPDRVKVLVSGDGEVFYQISTDKLYGLTDTTVPASEVIHDRMNCFYHPLVGLSPLTACGISVGLGLSIQHTSATLFGNNSRPSGILSVPSDISKETAQKVKSDWQANYSGIKRGGIAVLGSGAKYEPIAMSASDSQAIEQLKMSGETVCSVFHVPAFKVGMGEIKAGQKVSDLNEIYYSDCLQHYIEAIENLLDEHLDLEKGVECEADLSPLIRMDSTSQMAYLKEGTHSGILSPNEARATLGLPPVVGGESPLMQQQNYSLEALAKRDNSADPFGNAPTPNKPTKSAKAVKPRYRVYATIDKDKS